MISIIRRKKRAVKGKTKKNKAQKRNWFTRVRVLFFARRAFAQPHRAARAGPAIARRSPLRAGARQACSTVRGEGSKTPRQASPHGARLCHAFPAPAPQAAVRQRGPRGPHTGHRPALPASPLCPSALPGQGRHPGSAKPRARPAGRTRGETYLPFSGRGACGCGNWSPSTSGNCTAPSSLTDVVPIPSSTTTPWCVRLSSTP